MDGESLYRIHQKGTEKEYTEYYYYVIEAKVMSGAKIAVSITTEFVENEGKEEEKQDCERKACWRLFEKLKVLFTFLTDLAVNKKNIKRLIEDGRRRWKIENEGFNQ